MSVYKEEFIASQDAVRKYAADVRNIQKKLDLAVDIILALRKQITLPWKKGLTTTLIPTKIQKQIDALTKGGYRG